MVGRRPARLQARRDPGGAAGRLRVHLVMRLARAMVRSTYRGSRAIIRWRKGKGAVDLRGSIFCEVRDRVEQPLCEFYASALRRLLLLFSLDAEVGTEQCRATGAGQCLMVDSRASTGQGASRMRQGRWRWPGAASSVAVRWSSRWRVAARRQRRRPRRHRASLRHPVRERNARAAHLLARRRVGRAPDRRSRALGVPVIAREDRLRAFDRLRVPPVATLSHATVIRLGQVVGAAQVVIGSFELDGRELMVRARTIRLDTGRMSAEMVERGPLNDLSSIYERLARRIGPDTSCHVERRSRGIPRCRRSSSTSRGCSPKRRPRRSRF